MSGERRRPGELDGSGLAVAIVCSEFNEEITSALLAGARRELAAHSVAERDVETVLVPGAFEIPLVARRLARSGRFDAVIALGAVIRGETGHYELVANETASGIARASLETDVPIIFGVLATETIEQARARSGGELGNRGEDAAVTAIEMATLLRAIAARES